MGNILTIVFERSDKKAWPRHMTFRYPTMTVFKFSQILIGDLLMRPNPVEKNQFRFIENQTL